MTNETAKSFMLSTDVFQQPHLDIYSQMAYIVLCAYTADSALPTLQQIMQQGRMNAKQASKAMQSLVELKVLPHKVFRQIVGEFADDRLSWAAKGLLTYCKDRPQIRLADLLELSSQSGEDEHTIRKALKELRRHGYLDEYPELNKIAN